MDGTGVATFLRCVLCKRWPVDWVTPLNPSLKGAVL